MRAGRERDPSLWVATSPSTEYPALEGELSVDVAVVGAGITGVTTARLLKADGRTVALVEARRIAHGVTGYTTAKLTVGHGLVYSRLRRSVGDDGARLYARSNQDAIERIARFVEEDAIDCDFERASNFVYTESPGEVEAVREEAAAAGAAGVDARFTTETELPFPVAGAVRVDGQAQFHPRNYVLPLAAAVAGDGCHVFERTRVRSVREGTGACLIDAGSGRIRARDVVLATHLPILDRGLFFAKAHPEASYAVSAAIAAEEAPRGMYISAGRPTRSIRSVPDSEAGRMLIVGGEGHKPGAERDTAQRYRTLEQFLVERFGGRRIEHRWSAHDYLPVDGLPYIGRLTRGSDHLFVATGFAKWGLTKGTLAAMLIADLIAGRANEWADLYDAKRLRPAASARKFLTENGQGALRFVRDRLRRRDGLGRLDREAGALVRVGSRQVAVYRDAAGKLHTLSPKCSHLGCIVGWNTADRTWDCPCHGSRFAATGEVIGGPALRRLEPATLDERSPHNDAGVP